METSEAEDQPQDWIFTFGYGQYEGAHRHHFVRIRGTFLGAREEMIRRYGKLWAMQYAGEDAAGVKEYNLTEIK